MKKPRWTQEYIVLTLKSGKKKPKQQKNLDKIMIPYYLKRIFENTFSKETGIFDLL